MPKGTMLSTSGATSRSVLPSRTQSSITRPTNPAAAQFGTQRVGDRLRRAPGDDETLVREQVYQLGDRGSAVYRQIGCQHVAEFDAVEDFSVGHSGTVASRGDKNRPAGA